MPSSRRLAKLRPAPKDNENIMKALLFGSIGVLVDSSALQHRAYNRAFDELGVDWHWEEERYRRMLVLSGGRERMHRYAAELGKDTPSDDMIARIHDTKTRLFDEALESGEAVARPGVARLVDAARERGIRLGFVTSTERANVGATAKAAGLETSDFDVITHRGNVGKEKPDASPYLKALSGLGIEASEAIAIEDTEPCVRSAIDAGVLCIATPNSFAGAQDFSAAVSVVDHLGDERRAARTLAGVDVVSAGMVTLDTLAELLEHETASDPLAS